MPLLFLWFFLTSTSLVSALQTLPCINTTYFIPNSTYDTNRRVILSLLPSNVTSHFGFFNGSIGQAPNRVYAVGMCLPGTEEESCIGCLLSASNTLLETCLTEENALIWIANRTICMIRYSDTSFVGSFELEPHREFLSIHGYKTNETEFNTVWSRLTQRMVQEASSSTDATWSGAKYYTADVAALPDSQTLYAMMQCTPDLSPAECNLCLTESVVNYQSCCLGRQGGSIVRLSCAFRAELYPFGGAFTVMTARPLSQPPPSLIKKGEFFAKFMSNSQEPRKVFNGNYCCNCCSHYSGRYHLLAGITTLHFQQLDFKTIEVATENFAKTNKLGQGGFGEVYKGTLVNGTEVAVKRLSKTSEQGAQEFKNEVVLVAKLQHRNLVKLLGYCLEPEEKILVYEFVPNKSLDYFLFDPTKQGQLDWTKRYNIIGGITRGILYLHQDSRLTIIHRDLKASNILLDADMIPKIADFGMARISGIDQSVANTKRIAGTFGYMPPEYVIHGQFSMKSDVYSFGVLILEIICGKKNRSFYQADTKAENLVTYVWRLWTNGSPLELVDLTISENCQTEEVIRCIHIALLCVQEDPKDRPNLSTIMMMLTNSSLILSVPQPPGFFVPQNKERDSFLSSQFTMGCTSQTKNDVTITNLDPR
ncbi:serine /threonine kinase-like protein [Arabidopsis thaliana]|nr:serine /threonine kinase-like protein [Arabidopsis thaliana]CAB79275.1 serine /threonine kinase-like protein [Arabidopsis thaliana]